ncbi:MAG: hypothetical protein ACQKBU_03895 [Verrucomicrobiales bacterium]
MLSNILKNFISAQPRFLDITGFQREAKTLSRGIRFMNREVAPPNASIVPEMMVWILLVDSESKFRAAL